MAFLENFIKRYRTELIVLVLLTCAYFSLRLYNIMSLPIFTDEAIYVRWAQIAEQDASWRFISLTDGKQPMFVWLAMLFLRIIDEPLFASRLVSVMAGFSSMVGLFFLGRELFKNRFIGLISAFLYVIFPFALVYDRMALYDSLVGMFTVWSLFFGVLLARRLRLDLALVLGMVIGGGVLTKTSGFFGIYLSPFLILLIDVKNKKIASSLTKFLGLILISIALSYGIYSVLRLSPFFHIIGEKNALFAYPFNEWISHPFTYFLSNLSGLSSWFMAYVTWPVLLLILSAFVINFKFLREKLVLIVWFILPFLALVLFGKTLYPRFIFFMTLSLLPLAAFSIYEIFTRIKIKTLSLLIIAAFLALFVRSDFYILYDFAKAPIANSDLGQYINGWAAGSGVKESVEFFKIQAKNQKIYIGTEGTFGLLPASYEIYLIGNSNVTIKGYWPINDILPEEALNYAKKMPSFFVFYQPQHVIIPDSFPLKLISKFRQGKSDYYYRVYQITPQ